MLIPEDKSIKAKILKFNETFQIIPPSQIVSLNEEISQIFLNSDEILFAKLNSKDSSLLMRDILKKANQNPNGSAKYPLLSKILSTVHALPTSSSGLEQSFSRLKFVKNALRSRMKAETVQALLLISEAFQGKDEITISNLMVELFDQVRFVLNKRKSSAKIKEFQSNEESKIEEKKDETQTKSQNIFMEEGEDMIEEEKEEMLFFEESMLEEECISGLEELSVSSKKNLSRKRAQERSKNDPLLPEELKK